MTDYLQAVYAMLGPGEERHADPAAWLSLEEELGRTFPGDYKQIVDAYAPVQINGHLTLSHPASSWWNLGEEIRSASEVWADSNWQSYITGPDNELLRVGHRSGDGPWGATDEAPGLLIEMSDVSTTLLGGLVGHPSCRTRPAGCTRGVGHHAGHHP
ncbi:hypothetical protein [Streptomyces durocortorensis]|uniref:hypothetical protein n=1 Tax=Streptomyces durocortorensis TaxID=2811104 RepID=UPI001EF724B0|nr:hypothetical protein [Streptomyces durocortorensis]